MLRVTTEWTGGGGGTPYFSTHHFTGETSLDAAAATADVATFWTNLNSSLSTTITWRVSADVEVVDPVTGNITALAVGTAASDTGDVAGSVLPLTTQGLIRWRTGIFSDGRELRGRTFVPAMTELASDLGVPNPATILDMNGAASALIGSPSSELLVWRRPREAQADPPLPARVGSTAIVATGSAWGQWASLRSRRD